MQHLLANASDLIDLGKYDIVYMVLGAVLVLHNFSIFMLILTWLSWLERRLCAWIQDRSGPNRVGPAGLLQPVADAIKLMQKEDLIPHHVEKFFYLLGPCLVALPALILFVVIPVGADLPYEWVGYVMLWGAEGISYMAPNVPFLTADCVTTIQSSMTELSQFALQFNIDHAGQTRSLAAADLPVGLAFLLAIGSLGVYGLALGAWGANNKYATMGGIRASAQMISYELALGVTILTLILMSGTSEMSGMTISNIVEYQEGYLWGFLPKWNILLNPITAVILIICYFAETNRLPFDFAEAEPELIAGYHIEHSGMKFALFMIGESAAMLTASALIVTLVFGGWDMPGLDLMLSTVVPEVIDYRLVKIPTTIAIFFAKTTLMVVVFILVRWSIPRFRYDHLMKLGWKRLLPAALAMLVITVAVKEIWNAIEAKEKTEVSKISDAEKKK